MTQTLTATSAAARRYAKALFLAAQEKGALDAVARDVELIRHATGHPEVSGWLADPRIEDEKKQSLLERELGKGAHELTQGFLKLIGRRRRHAILVELPVAFQALADEHSGTLRGVVESPKPLDDSQRGELEKALSAKTGKRVLLETQLDESLLGGVRVTLGGTRYDGTLTARVEAVRRKLLTAEIGRDA